MWPPERVNRCETPALFRVSATRCPPCRGAPIPLSFSRGSVLYPIESMPIFHRKGDAPRPLEPASRQPSPAKEDEPDWRSFDSVAETYARVIAPNFATVAADLVGFLQASPSDRVLDVGTGTGVGARAALTAVGDRGLALGIDPSIG